MNEFREAVREYRVRYGISQQEFAKRCGLSRPTICAIENKEHYYVNLITRHKLEQVLNDKKEEEK